MKKVIATIIFISLVSAYMQGQTTTIDRSKMEISVQAGIKDLAKIASNQVAARSNSTIRVKLGASNEIQYSISYNGSQYTLTRTLENNLPDKEPDTMKLLTSTRVKDVRDYLKIEIEQRLLE